MEEVSDMNFETALGCIKKGLKVTRKAYESGYVALVDNEIFMVINGMNFEFALDSENLMASDWYIIVE